MFAKSSPQVLRSGPGAVVVVPPVCGNGKTQRHSWVLRSGAFRWAFIVLILQEDAEAIQDRVHEVRFALQ